MSETWEKLTEVFGSLAGEGLKSYLEAHDVSVRLIQESVGKLIGGTLDVFGTVEVFVPKEKLEDAKTLLETYQNSLDEGVES
ncbi:MAG: hypothetical protein Kow002_11150 [Anaerolineales bacterium]